MNPGDQQKKTGPDSRPVLVRLSAVLLGAEAGNLLLHIHIADRDNLNTAVPLFTDTVTRLDSKVILTLADELHTFERANIHSACDELVDDGRGTTCRQILIVGV